MAASLSCHSRKKFLDSCVSLVARRSATIYGYCMPSRTTPPILCSRIWAKCFCSVSDAGRENRYFPRRAVMYVPANDERKVKKAKQLCVDTVVFDIEDGVALNQKVAARSAIPVAVSGYRASGCGRHQEVVVRVNGVDSGMLQEDLSATLGNSGSGLQGSVPDSLMLPKCESVEHLRQLDLLLAGHVAREPHPSQRLLLHAIIESPRALLDLRDILRYGMECARHFIISSVVFGSDDFLAALGGSRTKDGQELIFARQSIVTHAKSFQLDAIDMVDINFKELDSLQKEAESGARLGFTGKQVIHPNQVPVVQTAFSPSVDQVDWAVGLIEAFRQHQASGRGAFEYRGASIDRPLLLQAQNIVRLQEMTAQ